LIALQRRVAPAVAAAVLLVACGNGESIQNAGNPPRTTVTTAALPVTQPPQTLAPGDTLAPGETLAPPPTEVPTTTVEPSTTIATPLADLPACPTDALAAATGPIDITFWHGLTADNEKHLTELTDAYNAGQTKVHVTLQNQGGYEQVIDKYLQSGQDSRPELAMAPEYAVQVFRDTQSFVPVQACEESDSYDMSAVLPAAVNAYSTGGVQWSMPFNVSNPVLYYNRKVFTAAGLNPDAPPKTLEEVQQYSQQIVDSGAASYGLIVDSDFDGGGGWYIEQWFAKAGQFYANNENGRSAPPTEVLFDGPTGVQLYTYLRDLVASGVAYNVGDNTSGQDAFLKIADQGDPGTMTIGTSAALGTVLAALQGGIAPGIGPEDLGVGQMPGPNGSATVLVGGASLWIAADKGDAKTAAAWDFVKFMISAQSQSTWAAATGYVPMRSDATALEPLATTYRNDPRFAVAYESLLATPDEPTAVGPLLGPQREVRVLTARALSSVFGGGDPATVLADAAAQADALLADYASRHPNSG